MHAFKLHVLLCGIKTIAQRPDDMVLLYGVKTVEQCPDDMVCHVRQLSTLEELILAILLFHSLGHMAAPGLADLAKQLSNVPRRRQVTTSGKQRRSKFGPSAWLCLYQSLQDLYVNAIFWLQRYRLCLPALKVPGIRQL